MAGCSNAIWYKNGEFITGSWSYIWHSDSFSVFLCGVDKITGLQRCFTCGGDSPNFNGWVLIKDEQRCDKIGCCKYKTLFVIHKYGYYCWYCNNHVPDGCKIIAKHNTLLKQANEHKKQQGED